MENEDVPLKYKPLSAWTYFGYQLLFAIPVVGLIFLLVFAFDDSNINRRNYARSFFCSFLVSAIILILVLILSLALGVYTATVQAL